MPARKVIIPEGMETIYDTYHYAPAIQVGDTLYLSGQVGRDKDLRVVEGTEAQYVQAFENVRTVLGAAGASFYDVIELETWFSDSMADLKTFLKVKDRYFINRYPTWTGFAVKGFSMPGILVEIKCKAILGLDAT
ncbi:RidA family protein [Aestuariivita sp.]|jgi:enamine deaminase RidA (YjgF/YER057c/UK114 family)|uniref:RidA family protein n=1 Tax=Aestuariivita sp. TaxID=1872407 RepID=UPI002172466F|nr:RidA family protein [Aestuariivita sp.]MCE8009038.1 RidA family protein [Aestuariivita sp.]